MSEINVLHSVQLITVDPPSNSLSVVHTGERGFTGPQGEQGIQGIQGVQGIQGDVSLAQLNAAIASDLTGKVIARSNAGLSGATVTGSESDCFPAINFNHVAGRSYRFFSRIRAARSTGSAVGGRMALYLNGAGITDLYFDVPASSAAWYNGCVFDYIWHAGSTGVATFKTTVMAYTVNINVFAEGIHYVQDVGPT